MNAATYHYLLRYSAFKPGALGAYKKALEHQGLPPADLQQISWRKTRALLGHAYEHVPWYNHRFKAIGLHPLDIVLPEHFQQVPILTREDMAENFERFISKKAGPKSLKLSSTGGSSGKPLKFAMGKYGQREVQKWQMYSWWGVDPGDNMVSLYRGLPKSGLQRLALGLVNWPQKALRVDATQIDPRGIGELIEKMRKTRPKLIHGYVGALDAVADHIMAHGGDFPAPKVVWATAAPITKIQENKISRAFKAPVCDQYGCSEMYFIASQCPRQKGLHVFADTVKLEILDPNDDPVPTGTHGRIVITKLDEYHFPMIRYANGDRGRFLEGSCDCGVKLPLIDRVKGRVSDNIVLPDGTVMAGEFLTTIFDTIPESIKQFQIIQQRDSSIDLNIVLNPKHIGKEKIVAVARDLLQARIQNQVGLRIHQVAEIRPQGGKLKFIIKEQNPGL